MASVNGENMPNCNEHDNVRVVFWEYCAQLDEEIFIENVDVEFEETVESASFTINILLH